MKVSDCCGAPARGDSIDMSICPRCRENCIYVDDEDEEMSEADKDAQVEDNAWDNAPGPEPDEREDR